jgi:peptidoglycan/LPS O-acetylase OafA/YrhL
MLFHGGAPGFQWGYIGVGVFFGICGYLITSILLNEYVETGHISVLISWQDRGEPWVGFPVVSLAVAVILAAASVGGWLANILGHPILVWIGRRSYGLYLWHYPVVLAGLLYFHLPRG